MSYKIYFTPPIPEDNSIKKDNSLLAALSIDSLSLNIHPSGSIYFTVDSETVKLLRESYFSKNTGCKILEFDIPLMVQSRTHKKRRIDKKWLKRYGLMERNTQCTANCLWVTFTPNEYDTVDVKIEICNIIIHKLPHLKYPYNTSLYARNIK